MKHVIPYKDYLVESKNIADLYHFTGFNSLPGILRSGLKFSFRKDERANQESGWRYRLSEVNDRYTKFISATRHKQIGKVLSGIMVMPIRFTLDAAAISNHYKIVPIDFVSQSTSYKDYKNRSPKDLGDLGTVSSMAANAFEERIISSKLDEINEYLPFKYIKKIDVFMIRDSDSANLEDVKSLLSASNIPYELHVDYPGQAAKYKSNYNLTNVKFEDGLTNKSLPQVCRKSLSEFIGSVSKKLNSDKFTVTVSELSHMGYMLRVNGDLPYYKIEYSEAIITASLRKSGIIASQKWNSDALDKFESLFTRPYFVDDYLNDNLSVYLGVDKKMSFTYERIDNECIIKDEEIVDSSVLDSGDIFEDIIQTLVPYNGYLLLPDFMMKYIHKLTTSNHPYFHLDKDIPNKVCYGSGSTEDL